MTETPRSTRPGPRRFPTWIVVILGAGVGGLFASWMGAGLGALLGTVVWLSRR